MPGDYNRVVLVGLVQAAPIMAGKGVRLTLRTEQNWTGAGGVARTKVVDHDILVMHPTLVTYAALLRTGDKVLVEGTLERGGTVVLGALHSSMQVLVRASDNSVV